jgi:hypothetical protein
VEVVDGMENAGAVRFDDRGDVTDMEYGIEFPPRAPRPATWWPRSSTTPIRRSASRSRRSKELVEREAKPRIDRRSEVVEACEAAPPRGAAA